MNAAFKQIRADKIIRIGLTVSLVVILLHIAYVGFSFLKMPPVLPLYNQLPWGEARLGTRLEIFIPIGITVVFFFVNYILIARLYATMPLVSRIIAITTMLVSILSLIFIVRTLELIL